ncbi:MULTISPECIES: hypothetical protein [Brevibacillus]|jgi:hypothetical protein|nr:hypothetical protein [Brevibacillus borstelensis]MCC0566285.1 hypothetical protein [Brevibacillus borstelensis]MCM3561095.1 hypothetical protein [Brevibacillus borstelensis]MED1876083.1 hypothetical protein [Brevibacillus borstelensis]MED1882866.1 hypothetical protein [Brevibacillus borstelensis]NOU56587.1 hypothetical protein [Brevibacillus borstelensis]
MFIPKMRLFAAIKNKQGRRDRMDNIYVAEMQVMERQRELDFISRHALKYLKQKSIRRIAVSALWQKARLLAGKSGATIASAPQTCCCSCA